MIVRRAEQELALRRPGGGKRGMFMAEAKISCVFIGTVTQDTLMLVEQPPVSDRRIAASKVVTASGGPASTAAAAYTQLGGGPAALMAPVGMDETAEFIRKDMQKAGIAKIELTPIAQAPSGFSFIQVEKDGKRCITHYGGCMAYYTPQMLDLQTLQQAQIIHLAGMTGPQTLEFVRFCRENTKAKISVDGGNLDKASMDAMLPMTDIFIPDHKTVEKAYGMSPEEACAHFLSLGVSIACVTCGENGLTARSAEGASVRLPSLEVPVVDTTGAGDNFHGAFLYAQYAGFDLEKALKFASAYASLTCTEIGGRTANPSLVATLQEMQRFAH